jgi:hypothetical protein
MQTPLDQLKQVMLDHKDQSCFLQLRMIKNAIDDLIEEERKQIEDAFLHGKRDGLFNVHQKPEDYFKSKYAR